MLHIRLFQVILTILLFVTILIGSPSHGSANVLIASEDILNNSKYTFFDDTHFLNQTNTNPAPVIYVISPDHGPASGGTLVTILGENFIYGAYVTFGPAHCTNVQVISSSQITCQTPEYTPAIVHVRVVNPDGQEAILWYGFTYHGEFATISLSHSGGIQHSIIQVPINMTNVEGLAAASLTISFDESVAQALEAETGSLTSDWMLVANNNTPGEIRLSMASTEGTVSGAGTLALIHFELIGAPGDVSSLLFDSISLNDGELQVDSFNGSLSVDMVYSISGVIDFWNGSVVHGTTLSLSGSQDYSTQSDPHGMYTIAGVLSGDYTLTPSKSDDVNGISSYDASLVLQHDAGLIVLAEYAFLAGDVNKNGSVTSMDAYYILQYVVDLISLPFPGADVVWDYLPSERTYSELSSDMNDQDFTAILLGDPSGSWSSDNFNAFIPHSEATGGILRLEASEPDQEGIVSVQVMLDQIDSPVYSLDLHLSYDADLATILDIEKTDPTTDWLMMANMLEPGILRIGMASSEPLEGTISSGEGGIRTHGALRLTRSPGARVRPDYATSP
jgi:hypothetical protein